MNFFPGTRAKNLLSILETKSLGSIFGSYSSFCGGFLVLAFFFTFAPVQPAKTTSARRTTIEKARIIFTVFPPRLRFTVRRLLSLKEHNPNEGFSPLAPQ